MITAKVIEDSISNRLNKPTRLTTLELSYPRAIHAELMTHRVFSRNASSNRAIPVKKLFAMTYDTQMWPEHWGSNKPGMQAGEELSGWRLLGAKLTWRLGATVVRSIAKTLSAFGLHKQLANRWLEPIQNITVLVTSTEWKNFFELRDHPDAQPEIRVLAQQIRQAMTGSNPIYREEDWHLPYVFSSERGGAYTNRQLFMISAARCARVSYMNHDGSTCNTEKDLELAEKLLESKHMSPFEHQAVSMHTPGQRGVTHIDFVGNLWSGNFRNWIQGRQIQWTD